MKLKVLRILLSFVLLFALSIQSIYAAPAKTVKVKVSLISVELIENNHVGNDWLTAGYVNGREIGEGSTVEVTLKAADSLKLEAYAEEQDKIPDTGSAKTTIKASTLSKTQNKALDVKVTENRGRYSGNSAKWKFVYKIQKQ